MQCNKFGCLWDNYACENIEPLRRYRDRRESYHQSVDFTQLVLDRKFNTKVANRTWNPHMSFMLDKRILRDIITDLPRETSMTRCASNFAKSLKMSLRVVRRDGKIRILEILFVQIEISRLISRSTQNLSKMTSLKFRVGLCRSKAEFPTRNPQ